MKCYRVRVIEDTEQDSIDIYTYAAANDSGEKADHLLDQLQTLCLSLDKLATRVISHQSSSGSAWQLTGRFTSKRIAFFIRSAARTCTSTACWTGDGTCSPCWSAVY